MGVSKVNYGNTTLVDLTGDSVSPEKLMQGETAHDRDGEEIVGTAINVNNLSLSTNTPADADEIITKESSTWYRKAFSKVWDYTKDKIKSVLGINEDTAADIFNVYGAKNFIPKQTSYTIGSDASLGWTEPTFNSDGTIDFGEFLGGTYCNCELSLTLSLPRTGDYIFTSGLTDASDSTAYIEVYKTYNATAIKVYNDPVTIENVNYIHKIILVSKDRQSRTFKPMLRTVGVENDDYVPYAMTNKQLTDSYASLDTSAARKVDLTNISITGTKNSTGSTISSGTYFYLNGSLVRAKANIASNATLTLNTNYETVTAGGLNKLNADIATLNSNLTTVLEYSLTSNSKIYRNNKTVTIKLTISDSIADLLGVTIPVGYRPTIDANYPVVILNNTNDYCYLGFVTIRTTGALEFYLIQNYGSTKTQITGGTVWCVNSINITYLVNT